MLGRSIIYKQHLLATNMKKEEKKKEKSEETGYKIKKIGLFVFCLLVVYAFAFLGSAFTSAETQGDWYKSIRPSITPPNFVFPIVWNIIFFLMAIALYYAFNIKNIKMRKKIISLFIVNLILNVLWSYFFFNMKNVALAFADIILLWLSILFIMIFSHKIDKKIVYLFALYLIWVSFASILNFLILLNTL